MYLGTRSREVPTKERKRRAEGQKVRIFSVAMAYLYLAAYLASPDKPLSLYLHFISLYRPLSFSIGFDS
jgi:hypothetical protein